MLCLMPTYEYECQDCGHRFEVFQRITEDPVSACEKCSGKVRKVILPVGIVFKGSGFHINDYRKPDPSAKSSETKTETAAASKEAG